MLICILASIAKPAQKKGWDLAGNHRLGFVVLVVLGGLAPQPFLATRSWRCLAIATSSCNVHTLTESKGYRHCGSLRAQDHAISFWYSQSLVLGSSPQNQWGGKMQGSASNKVLGYVANWLHKVLLPKISEARPIFYCQNSGCGGGCCFGAVLVPLWELSASFLYTWTSTSYFFAKKHGTHTNTAHSPYQQYTLWQHVASPTQEFCWHPAPPACASWAREPANQCLLLQSLAAAPPQMCCCCWGGICLCCCCCWCCCF